jgi:hypothetical protein
MSWGLVAVAGATLVGGVIASNKAGDAADAQAEGAAAATAEQRRQFDITQQNLQPFQRAGESALEQQRILLGLGGTDPNAAQRADLESQLAAFGSEVQPQQSQQQNTPISDLTLGQRATLNQPQQQAGTISQRANIQAQLDALPQFNPGTNAEQQQSAFDQFNQSPGQQFLRDRAQKNLLRNSAAIGGLGGGNVRSALVEQAVGFAQQDFNNQFGRLGQLAGQGQNAATNVSQLGQRSANTIGNNLMASGNARASGLINQSNAMQNTIGGLTNVAGQFFNRPASQPPVQTGSFQQTGQFSGNINPFARTS